MICDYGASTLRVGKRSFLRPWGSVSLRTVGGDGMERIETKTEISKRIVRRKPRTLYAIGREWKFKEDETEWIKNIFKTALPNANKREKDIESFIQDLQQCCSDKKLSLERAKDPELKPLNKRDLERVRDICDEAYSCLWAIQAADYLLVDSDQKFVLEAKEKARTAMKPLFLFALFLGEKLLKKKSGRSKSPHINFVKEIIEIYKKHIRGQPTQKELREIVVISLEFLGLPSEDPSRVLRQALTKLS